MALSLKLNLKLTQKLVMTPMLQQAIKLLPLARLELVQKVRQELIENPMLDEVSTEEVFEEEREDKETSDKDEKVEDSKEVADENPEIDWENFIQNNIDKGLSSDGLIERPSIETTLKSETSFSDHLFWQLMTASVSKNEKLIGAEIIGNLNNSGYLECPPEEIAQYLKVNIEDVEKALQLIQTFEPSGVGARNLQECLLLQVENLAPDYELVKILLKNYINQLEEKFFKKISKELKVNISDILGAIKFIKELNPKPASKFSNEQPQYIIPDVTVIKDGNDYKVVLNDDGVPSLRVNPLYRRMIQNKDQSSNVKEYLEEKQRAAVWLIKSIEQRRQTILKVAKSIVKFQKDFFDHGLSCLKPLILRIIAEDIDMHESTVSRVTTMKYMHTPRGIFYFKFFFHSGIDSFGGDEMSSVQVRDMIREVIEREDSKKPLTDQQIVQTLKQYDVKIARRTVTKYRQEMNFSSANKRRRLY